MVLVGWRAEAAGRRPVVLCRLLRDGNAYEVVHMLASRLNTDRLILLTPTERSLGVDVLNSLNGRGVEIVSAELALQGSAAHPFALRLEGWAPPAGSVPAAAAAVFVDTGGHRAFFLGRELRLPSREFKVLIALARAFASGGYVPQDRLYDSMYTGRNSGEAFPPVLARQAGLGIPRRGQEELDLV